MIRRLPKTFWFGLALIALLELALFADVVGSERGAIRVEARQLADAYRAESLPLLRAVARWIAFNFTALIWIAYVLLLDGLLCAQRESPVRRRPHHFAMLFLASIVIWCTFDTINFYSIRAWTYIGMPPDFWRNRAWAYFLAFGTIVPAMLMSGQVLLNFGLFNWARSPAARWRMPGWLLIASLIVGGAMLLWPVVHPDPVTNLTLWTSLVFLLDPINAWLGRPSMFRDWQNGWYGRMLAAFSGGLVCGLLWEFWNYWALTKWTYHLPFLGAAEHIRYFEMPVLGLLGFIPFGLECWIIWQFLRIPLDGLVEQLPDDRALL